jgi:hypothetical protein
VTDTLAYYNTAKITTVNSFIVQGPGLIETHPRCKGNLDGPLKGILTKGEGSVQLNSPLR